MSKGRRALFAFMAVATILLIATFQVLAPQTLAVRLKDEADFHTGSDKLVIMPSRSEEGEETIDKIEMTNETAKAELGRAGWRLLHTMGQRYPDHPTADEKQTFSAFLHLFARMYPCGECAEHFQSMLQEYPVQSSSKTAASLYLCMLHNNVNVRLKKPEFDCSKLEGLYDCGCNDDAPKAAPASQLAVGTTEEGEDSQIFDPLTGEELIPG